MKLSGKTVLITGAARRIGRAIAEALAAEGCRLALHCRRSVSEARALAASLRRSETDARVFTCDLSRRGAPDKLIGSVCRAFGGLDALVNNAAVFSKRALAETPERELRGELEVNLLAPMLLTRAFALAARGGAIVNILDRRIASAESGMAGYLLSKKALASFTLIAAADLAPRIAVNAVAPGPVLRAADRSVRDMAGTLPLGRRPTAADVAEAVVYLLKSEAITGQIIFVDGGQHLLGGCAQRPGMGTA